MTDSQSRKIAEGHLLCEEQDYSQRLSAQNKACLQNRAEHSSDVTRKLCCLYLFQFFVQETVSTAVLFVYCAGALIGRCEGQMNLKVENIREFLDQQTDCRLTCGQKYQWESELFI
jgi:hypothetical protein